MVSVDLEDVEPAKVSEKVTPLPKLQLSVLLLLLLAEPITSTVIYPFINQVSSYFGLVRISGLDLLKTACQRIGNHPRRRTRDWVLCRFYRASISQLLSFEYRSKSA
jgi:hypothetical protein